MGDWTIQEQQYQCDMCSFVYPKSRMRRQLLQAPSGGYSGNIVCERCWDPFYMPNLIGTTTPRENYEYESARNLNETAADAVAVPALASISPASTTAAAFLATPTITCTGTGFTARSRVQFRYLESFMVTTYVSATSVTAVVYPGLIEAGSHSVRVVNIGPPFANTGVEGPNGIGNNTSNTLTMVLT